MYRFELFTNPPTSFEIQSYFEDQYQIQFTQNNYFSYLDREEFLVISENEWKEIIETTQKVNQIFSKAYQYAWADRTKLYEDFGPCSDWFCENYPFHEHVIARYDVLIEKDTGILKYIENNANTPGMITDVYRVTKLLFKNMIQSPSEPLIHHIKQFFTPYQDLNMGILLPQSFEDEDFLVGLDYLDLLKQALPNTKIVLGDLYDTHIVEDETLTIKGEKVDVIFNFCPLEFFLSDRDFALSFFRMIHEKKITLVNPFESIIMQDKGLFATVYEHFDHYTPSEQETILKHLPFTTRELPPDETDYLAKIRFGRVSQNIFLEHFESKIGETRDYIFQKKVTSEDFGGNFLVLGIYHNFHNTLGIIARRSRSFLLDDDSAKVVLVATER